MDSCEIRAYAKINLGLDITGLREDGYHLLKMVMQTVSLSDRLKFTISKSPGIRLESSNRFLNVGPKNIVYKTASMIMEKYGIKKGVSVSIEKKIPIAAGLAGGSADAAVTLIAMDHLFGLNIDDAEMFEYGASLGADIPFCLMGGTALAEGIGEKLTPLPGMPECQILLVKPKFGISTSYVYQKIDRINIQQHPRIDAIIDGLDRGNLSGVCENMGNVLELVSCAEHPELEVIKARMTELGAIGAMMSGSGPTVFGIFDDINAARKAYSEFKCGEYGQTTFLTGPMNTV